VPGEARQDFVKIGDILNKYRNCLMLGHAVRRFAVTSPHGR